jgi:hypothetical protein
MGPGSAKELSAEAEVRKQCAAEVDRPEAVPHRIRMAMMEMEAHS